MAQFSADQIIGKSLIAKIPVKIYRIPTDGSPAVFTADVGENVGIVTSYLLPGSSRSALYWEFKDPNNRPYYAKHETGKFDIRSLQEQGALTLQQQQEQLQEKNRNLSDKIISGIKMIALIGAGAYVLGQFIKSR